MKKFKVVEEGRFLKADLEKVKGGCTVFTGCNTYDNCGLVGGFTTCRPGSAAYGYEAYCLGQLSIICRSGYEYASCTGRSYTSCPSQVSLNSTQV